MPHRAVFPVVIWKGILDINANKALFHSIYYVWYICVYLYGVCVYVCVYMIYTCIPPITYMYTCVYAYNERERGIFLLQVHFPSTQHSWGWTRPKSEVRTPSGTPFCVAVAQILGPFPAIFSGALVGNWIKIRAAEHRNWRSHIGWYLPKEQLYR